MKIDLATKAEVREVALNMRPRDFLELAAVNPTDNRFELADMLAERYGEREDTFCVHNDFGPVAIGGALELRPNVLSLLFFATPEFPDVALGFTKWVTRRLFPPLIAEGVHRIEAATLEGYDDVHRWLETLGLKREFVEPMRGYGKKGEPFAQFAWWQE